MDRRILTIVTVIVLAAVVIAPVASSDSDADNATGNERFSKYHLMLAQVEVKTGDYINPSSSLYIFEDGSYQDRRMDSYIRDHDSVDIRDGEFQEWTTVMQDMTLNVYYMSASGNDPVYFNGQRYSGTSVLEPYGNDSVSFFVLAGDTFKIAIANVSNHGDRSNLSLERNGYSNSIESGFYEYDVTSPTNFIYSAYSYSSSNLYYEIQYSASGFSTPSGSPTMYFVICAVVTFAVLAVLAYAGLKPKWSK